MNDDVFFWFHTKKHPMEIYFSFVFFIYSLFANTPSGLEYTTPHMLALMMMMMTRVATTAMAALAL